MILILQPHKTHFENVFGITDIFTVNIIGIFYTLVH